MNRITILSQAGHMRMIAIAASWAMIGAALAQGSSADYERADSLRERTSGKLMKNRVEPNWIGDSSNFWYRRKTGQGQHRFILVKPNEPSRTDAFDHQQLASALETVLDKEVTPNNLPFKEIRFSQDLSEIEFSTAKAGFRYQLSANSLHKVKRKASANGTTVPILPALRTARYTRGSTEISFVNKTDETLNIYWVGQVESPTGYGSVAAGKSIDQHTYAGHVWLVSNSNDKPLGIYEATNEPGIAVIDGSWRPEKVAETKKPKRRNRGTKSPDGSWIAKIHKHNVQIVETSTGTIHDLSKDGIAQDAYEQRFYWSADSKKLAVLQVKRPQKRVVEFVESSPKKQLQPITHQQDYVKPGDEIDHPRPRLFDIPSLKPITINDSQFPNPWSLSDFRWSPDSSQFTFLYNQRGHQVLRVIAVDAQTGTSKALIDESPETFVCYSSKTFYRPISQSDEIIWMSERDGWNHLYLFDAATGTLENQITKGEWVVREVDEVDSEKRQIWFQAGGIHTNQDPYHVHFCRIDFDGSNLVVLTAGDGTHSIKHSPDGKFLVDVYSRVDLPPVTELRRSKDGSLVLELEQADASALLETGWTAPERFVTKGRDGQTEIYGIIHKPTNFDPQRRYPVIEQIYAGPHSAHVPKRFSSNGSSTAELGFIVVQIDGMGTSHRSKAFHDICWQNIGDAGFPDRVLWIKAAGRSRPWMDLTRVGIYGGSAGGQNAMRALIAHHDFYHVAVADCGCHDNRMDKIWWNEQWMGFPVRDAYAASSNVDHAHKMEGKLMLIVGELDRNVDPASTMQVANALIKADKDFELVVIPGAGHGAAGTPYGKRRQRDFLVRHLLGVEPRHEPYQ